MGPLRLALIGDFQPDIPAHQGINRAIPITARSLGYAIHPTWIDTESAVTLPAEAWTRYHAFWCVPASPYRSMTGALRAIQFARQAGRPFLGTCGGFQHALLEFARNVAGLPEADHAESNPEATVSLISPLVCPLREVPGQVRLQPGSQLAAIYGKALITEQYFCGFGLNPVYRAVLERNGLQFTAFDPQGAVRAFELKDNDFYVGTLFQPERAGLRGEDHPLIAAWLRAAAGRARN
jgi:CTP synthase (UTP-ammonia lyase)